MSSSSHVPFPVDRHPWWPVCIWLSGDNRESARSLIEQWRSSVVPTQTVNDLQKEHACDIYSDRTWIIPEPDNLKVLRLESFGTSFLDWQLHAWLQRCPLPRDVELVDDVKAPRVAINFLTIEDWLRTPELLLELASFCMVFDPDPSRVHLLRCFGVPAMPLLPEDPSNGWLNRVSDSELCSQIFGLPHPASIAGPNSILALGTAGPEWVAGIKGAIHGWPGFDQVEVTSHNDARLLAHWLESCSCHGIQLVRLNPTAEERLCRGFNALSLSGQPSQLPAQLFCGPITADTLVEELVWRRAGKPEQPCATPTPDYKVLWEKDSGIDYSASVCISLYNYADRILAALDSVARQSQPDLELIIVDDRSSDNGAKLVRDWLRRHHNQFSRSLLVQHQSNSGLAATRNTAFRLARSSWCFVLDADNLLLARAVEQCLKASKYAPASAAAIIPLIERKTEAASMHKVDGIVSGLSWQKSHFLKGNYVDAMALIRKSAWKTVGGYSHIEGGWEDFDFWCKLIENDFHGILFPQVLAVYVAHADSMVRNATDINVRSISRRLNRRHTWLQLPMAEEII